MSKARGRRVLMTGLLGMGVLALTSVPAAAGSAAAITFDLKLGEPCIDGQASANEKITLAVKTPGGQLRGRETTRTGPDGFFSACPLSLSGIQGRDVVLARDATSSRSWQVPDISPHSDRVMDRVSGEAPPGTGIDLTVTRGPLGQLNAGQGHSLYAAVFVVGSSGKYNLAMPGNVDLLGGDSVTVHASFGSDNLTAQSLVPFVYVSAGNNVVEGSTNPGEPVTLDLMTPGGTSRAHLDVTALLLGIFIATLQGPDGQAIYPRPGDRLHASIGGGVTLRIPHMGLRGNPSTDVISGRCMANASYRVEVSRFAFPGAPQYAAAHGTTASDGAFENDFSGRLNVKGGDALTLTCQYAGGDLLVVNSTVPPPH